MNILRILIVFIILNIMGMSSGLQARTIRVPEDEATITAALAAADDGDEIILADQTFTETGLAVNDSITITGQGPDFTIVQAHATEGSATARVFTIAASKIVTLKNMTIRHGKDSDNSGAGGILSGTDSVLTLENCVISRNTCSGNLGGGGMYIRGTLTMKDCTVSHNSRTSVMGSGGGAGIRCGTATICNCAIVSNICALEGGGIFCGNATLTNCTISGNSSGGTVGGGGFYTQSTVTLINCTITDNTAGGSGSGGGMLLYYSTVSLKNTIVANNSGTNPDISKTSGTLTSLDYNLVENVTGAGGCIDGDHDITGEDPNLDALAYNQGPTPTHALLTGSPAINAGTDAGAPTTDQRYFGRNGATDIGAYEYEGTTPFVISALTPDSGPIAGSNTVVISGTFIDNGLDVTNLTLKDVTVASIDSRSATQIVVTAGGSGSAGTGHAVAYSIHYGITTKSNVYTYYIGSEMTVLGTNGATIIDDETPSVNKGTDFGSLSSGAPAVHVFSITNGGDRSLDISGVTTSGAGAAYFAISGWPATVEAGAVSNFTVTCMLSSDVGTHDATLIFTNNSVASLFQLNVRGIRSKMDQTIVFPNPGNQIITSQIGLLATASSGLPVTFAIGNGPAQLNGGSNLSFIGTGTVSITASQTGNTNWNAAPTVTNTFNMLPAPVPPTPDGWLAINVTPASGSWSLTAPSGYTGPTSGTGSLSAVNAVTGQYGVSYGALSGYVAPSNQAGFVTGSSTTLFTAVYLQISTNIATPAGVNATEGTYTNKIRVVWNGVDGATGYEIWRSQTNDPAMAGRIADIPLITLRRLDSVNCSAELCSAAAPQCGALQPDSLEANVEHSTSNAQHPTSIGQSAERRTLNTEHQSPAYYYDDYAISPVYAYYYWVRAKTATLISPMSYVGMGYAALLPDQKTGSADIGVSDLVYLPVNATNLSHAGTVSYRLANYGPDALNAAGVVFDFHMGTNAANMVWIGAAQSNVTLNANGEQLIILDSSAKGGLVVRGDLSGIQTVQVTVRHLSALNDPNLANNTTTAAGTVRIKTSGKNSIGRGLNDYDGDGKADGCLYQNILGRWYGELSGMRYSEPVWIGDVGMGWIPVPGDYDGDGITDVAAYDSLNRQWLVRFSSDGQVVVCQYGGPEFAAVPCDIDGDAKTDPVVYREADGYWAGAASSRGYASCYTYLGETGYQPVMADYDGDGLADPAVYNEKSSLWGIALSGSGYQLLPGLFGGIGYLPAPADYDGDGLTDPAIYAPATAYWQVLLSGSLATHGYYTWWGGVAGNINGIPVPADYDGDGKADLAVYHQDSPSAGSGQAGIWELFLSANGYQLVWGGFGGPEYQPARE